MMRKTHAYPFRAAAMLLTLILLVVSLSGCAVIEKENRILTRVLWTGHPDEGVVSGVTLPVFWIASVPTLIVDGFIINPVKAAPAAGLDAIGYPFFGFGIILPLEVILLIPRVVAVPVVFIGSDVARCSIPYVF